MSGETEIVVRVRGREPIRITGCESRISRFVEADAYADYDYAGSLISNLDVLTVAHRRLINDAMRARSSVAAWEGFLDRSLPELAAIPRDLDLIDGADVEVDAGIEQLAALCDLISGVKGLTDMAASKMLFMLRPRFVPISDSYVRQILGVPDYPRGGVRIASLAAALRELASDNVRELGDLDRYVRELRTVVPVAGRFTGREIPLVLSKVRILDILMWSEQAIFGATPNPWWKPWWDAGPTANGIQSKPTPTPTVAVDPGAAADRSGDESVLVFYRQELEYAAYLDAGAAFVCNNLGYGPSAHRVHHSSCRMLESAGWARDGVRTMVKKACARQLPVLVDWLTQAYGGEGAGFQYCRFCNPVSRM